MWSRVLVLLFAAFVITTAVHIGWVVHHEPFGFDAWNVAVDTHAEPFTIGRFFDYWKLEYTHSNPRFGQPFAYLGYKLEWFAVIATPFAYLAISLAITVIGLARWPFRRGRDIAIWAVVIGAMWFSLPQVGKMLFCRAYAANYIYALAVQLWFLVPLRLARKPSTVHCVLYGAFGVIAGMCNEHTGPTLCAFMLFYTWWLDDRVVARMCRWGAFGSIIGFALIFFAPGQNQRYDNLATKVSMVGRLLGRGVTGNVEILRDLLLGIAPILGLIAVLGVVAIAGHEPETRERVSRHGAARLLGIAAIASVMMAVTIFVSPKLGPRFYYASSSILLAGFVALADTIASKRLLAVLVTLSVVAEAYAIGHTVPLYQRVSHASEARMAELEAAPRGSVFIANSFEQVDESWWFLGDDFRDAKKREMVASYFALRGVVFHAYDPSAPLGLAGVRLVPQAKIDPPACLTQPLALGQFKGFDMAAMHREIQIAIDLLRAQLTGTLQELDIEVTLDDPRVTFPRKHIFVGKWTPQHYESYVAAIDRKGRSTTRTIVVPDNLAGFDIIAYQVGGEARTLDRSLQYVPWHPGVYWILACRADECFVIAASRQGA